MIWLVGNTAGRSGASEEHYNHSRALERISGSHRKVCEGKRDSCADVGVLD